jgi:hypothetical protein
LPTVEVKQGAGRLVRTARLALQAYLRAGCTQHAAAISYRVLFSLVPFLALLAAVLEVAVPETRQERIVEWVLAEVPLPVDLRPTSRLPSRIWGRGRSAPESSRSPFSSGARAG